MKLYYNTKGYGTRFNKRLSTIMSDDLTLMWNIDLSKESDINQLAKGSTSNRTPKLPDNILHITLAIKDYIESN